MAKAKAKRIVITGVSRGLGRAMVEALIAGGHTVFGCARSTAAIKELKSQFGSPHSFEALDVSRDDKVAAWAGRVLADGGPPDLLLNNAALINDTAPLWKVPVDEFDRVIDVNIKGVVNVIRHFVPAMIARKQGVIVNFSSGWGRSVAPNVAPYCATKFAIEGLTKALAEELPRGMAAVPLSPGVINTDMLQVAFGDEADSHPDPGTWGKKAVPYILSLGPKNNGESLRVPG